jgi:uncharacterized protein (DUF58 family)
VSVSANRESAAASVPSVAQRSLSNLQWLARKVVEGIGIGLHQSHQRGASLTFKQHRAYVPGDELRRLDWRAFARSDRHYIREFEQETNLRATLLVDVSGSMGYRGNASEHSKAEYAKILATSVATLLIQQQDAVGLITFDSKIHAFLKAESLPRHLKSIAKTLEAESPEGDTSIAEIIRIAAPRLPARGLVILISDCLDDVPALVKSLALLRHSHHEVVVFQIFDPDEINFPFSGSTRFESLEPNHTDHFADANALKRRYLENLERFRANLTSGCRQHGVDLTQIVTDEPCAEVLNRYLSQRIRRT